MLRYFTYITSIPDTTYVYYKYDVYPAAAGDGDIITSGSSTTVSSGTAGHASLRGLAVGDLMWIRPSHDAATVARKVATWTDVDTIVVNTAIDIATATTAWSYHKLLSGTTTATAPRHSLRSFRKPTIHVNITTLGSATNHIIFLGWGNDFDGPITIYDYEPTATGTLAFPINEDYTSISVGLKSGTPGTDAITITLQGENL